MFFMLNLDNYLCAYKVDHYYICLNYEEYFGGKQYKRYKDLPRGRGLITCWLVTGNSRERILSENITSDPKITKLQELLFESIEELKVSKNNLNKILGDFYGQNLQH